MLGPGFMGPGTWDQDRLYNLPLFLGIPYEQLKSNVFTGMVRNKYDFPKQNHQVYLDGEILIKLAKYTLL